jgi:transcriptional regulator with GAF, ATPase, and Fis domain
LVSRFDASLDVISTHRRLADLYNRLNPYPIKTPPLREHLEDAPLLIEPSLKKVGARARLQYEVRFVPAVLDTLCNWGYR